MADQNRLDLLTGLIDQARRLGADAADAVSFDSASLVLAHRMGKPEGVERAESADLGLRVLIGRRQAVASTNDLSPRALAALAAQAIDMARAAPEDPWCGLADPALLAKDPPALDIAEAGEATAELLTDRAAAAEDAARAVAGVTNSEGAEAQWSSSRVALATSTGFAGAYATTGNAVSVSVLAGTGTAMESDYDFDHAVYASDLRDPAAIGRRAGERAVKRLNPRKMATVRVPVVFDARVSGRLLRSLAGAISGSAIARSTSFLKSALDTRVFASGITIIDDPHRRRGLRSKPFDGEGVANRRRDMVSDGVLKSWFLDSASARQLGLVSTGHAARGTSSPPAPAPSNFYIAAGSQSVDDMIKEVGTGLLVDRLMGMGVNLVTGDFSQGAAGFWIEDGAIAYPVSEITIASNLKDMFQTLAAASDLEFRTGTDAPSLRVETMTVAGK